MMILDGYCDIYNIEELNIDCPRLKTDKPTKTTNLLLFTGSDTEQ